MSRQSKYLIGIIVLAVAIGIFLWSPPGRNMLGGNYGGGGTTTVKTP